MDTNAKIQLCIHFKMQHRSPLIRRCKARRCNRELPTLILHIMQHGIQFADLFSFDVSQRFYGVRKLQLIGLVFRWHTVTRVHTYSNKKLHICAHFPLSLYCSLTYITLSPSFSRSSLSMNVRGFCILRTLNLSRYHSSAPNVAENRCPY